MAGVRYIRRKNSRNELSKVGAVSGCLGLTNLAFVLQKYDIQKIGDFVDIKYNKWKIKFYCYKFFRTERRE